MPPVVEARSPTNHGLPGNSLKQNSNLAKFKIKMIVRIFPETTLSDLQRHRNLQSLTAVIPSPWSL